MKKDNEMLLEQTQTMEKEEATYSNEHIYILNTYSKAITICIGLKTL